MDIVKISRLVALAVFAPKRVEPEPKTAPLLRTSNQETAETLPDLESPSVKSALEILLKDHVQAPGLEVCALDPKRDQAVVDELRAFLKEDLPFACLVVVVSKPAELRVPVRAGGHFVGAGKYKIFVTKWEKAPCAIPDATLEKCRRLAHTAMQSMPSDAPRMVVMVGWNSSQDRVALSAHISNSLAAGLGFLGPVEISGFLGSLKGDVLTTEWLGEVKRFIESTNHVNPDAAQDLRVLEASVSKGVASFQVSADMQKANLAAELQPFQAPLLQSVEAIALSQIQREAQAALSTESFVEAARLSVRGVAAQKTLDEQIGKRQGIIARFLGLERRVKDLEQKFGEPFPQPLLTARFELERLRSKLRQTPSFEGMEGDLYRCSQALNELR